MSYTSALTFLNILPVAYYIQLNTFLLLRKIVTDYFDYNFSEHIQFFHSPQDSREGPSQEFSLQEPTQTRPRVLRHGPIVSFTSIRPLKSLCEQNFWFQATSRKHNGENSKKQPIADKEDLNVENKEPIFFTKKQDKTRMNLNVAICRFDFIDFSSVFSYNRNEPN